VLQILLLAAQIIVASVPPTHALLLEPSRHVIQELGCGLVDIRLDLDLLLDLMNETNPTWLVRYGRMNIRSR
jgi:hypothetical protein